MDDGVRRNSIFVPLLILFNKTTSNYFYLRSYSRRAFRAASEASIAAETLSGHSVSGLATTQSSTHLCISNAISSRWSSSRPGPSLPLLACRCAIECWRLPHSQAPGMQRQVPDKHAQYTSCSHVHIGHSLFAGCSETNSAAQRRVVLLVLFGVCPLLKVLILLYIWEGYQEYHFLSLVRKNAKLVFFPVWMAVDGGGHSSERRCRCCGFGHSLMAGCRGIFKLVLHGF
jgi:hypothetical protein